MAAPSAFSVLLVAVALLGVLQPAATSPPASPPAARPRGTAPENCSWTLYQLYNCSSFLSTGTALAGPPASCCSNLRATLSTPDSICLCHLYGGEFNEVVRINVDPFRLALLPIVCLAIVPPQLPYMCFVGPVPPISTVPPGPQATLDSVASTVPLATLPRAVLKKDQVAGRG